MNITKKVGDGLTKVGVALVVSVLIAGVVGIVKPGHERPSPSSKIVKPGHRS
jgi:hypothetical protein